MRSVRPKIVIVGAGFGGLEAAKRLAHQRVDVTVIDRRNHHLFQPLLYQVATAALSPADIAAPIRSILANARNVRVLLDSVCAVIAAEKVVRLQGGAVVEYDWLVVGGGPTGVEMAGAIAELARKSVSRDFRSITPHCSRVILVEAGLALLPAFPKGLQQRTLQSLEQLGVEVHLGAAVTEIAANKVCVGNDQIAAHTIVWAAGVQASPAAEWLGAAADRLGRVKVTPELNVPNHPEIFVIGDTAACGDGHGKALPGIAPVAKQQGRYVADRILGRTRDPFRYRDYGNLATIGRSRAVADFGRIRLSGFAAWLVWCVAHVWFLVGFRSRLSVMLSWAWNYLTFARSARLITGPVQALPAPAAAPLKGAIQ